LYNSGSFLNLEHKLEELEMNIKQLLNEVAPHSPLGTAMPMASVKMTIANVIILK